MTALGSVHPVIDGTGAVERRIARLDEELADEGFELSGSADWRRLVLTELDYALRPSVHEHRVPSYGAIVEPTVDGAAWESKTELAMTRRPVGKLAVAAARRFADGMSSWLIRHADETDELVVFDRPAGSERDLVVLAESTGATMVQRHPNGVVRCVGDFGVLRFDGITWQRETPVGPWIDAVGTGPIHGNRKVLERLLEFAVHDLGSRRIGATLIYRPADHDSPVFEQRLPVPPPLQIGRASDLAPLRHVLSQVDGAAVFDTTGTLRLIGVRLVSRVRRRRQTWRDIGACATPRRVGSAIDDRDATVIVVSDEGPVTVFRNGEMYGWSTPS